MKQFLCRNHNFINNNLNFWTQSDSKNTIEKNEIKCILQIFLSENKDRLLTYEMFANRFNKKNVGFDKMLATLMYNPNYTSDCLFISYLLNDNTETIFFIFLADQSSLMISNQSFFFSSLLNRIIGVNNVIYIFEL